jgi:hypothetical protein
MTVFFSTKGRYILADNSCALFVIFIHIDNHCIFIERSINEFSNIASSFVSSILLVIINYIQYKNYSSTSVAVENLVCVFKNAYNCVLAVTDASSNTDSSNRILPSIASTAAASYHSASVSTELTIAYAKVSDGHPPVSLRDLVEYIVNTTFHDISSP